MLVSTTTKTDNNPHPQAEEGGRSSAPPPPANSTPTPAHRRHSTSRQSGLGGIGYSPSTTTFPPKRDGKLRASYPSNERSPAHGDHRINTPPCSLLRGKGQKTPRRKCVPRSPPRPPRRDLAPCPQIPVLLPQQTISSCVHMASGVHMAKNGP